MKNSTSADGFECPVCESTSGTYEIRGIRDWEFDVPGEWDYVRCGGCGIVSLFPIPSDETIRQSYVDDYSSWSQEERPSLLLRLLRGPFDLLRYREVHRFVARDSAVLDVGCGDGYLMQQVERMTSGRVVGLDISERAVTLARERGLEVHHGTLLSLDEEPESFDVIMMVDSLEHTWSLNQDIEKAASLLKSGGRFYGVVPNFAALDRHLFGRYWGGSHVPRHLLQFERGTLSAVLAGHGFTDFRRGFSILPTTIAVSIQNSLEARKLRAGRKRRLVNGRAPYYPVLLLSCLALQIPIMLARSGGLMSFSVIKRSAP